MISKKLQVWLPLLFSIMMVIGMWLGYQLRANTTGSTSFISNTKSNSLQEVLNLIQNNYVDSLSMDSLKIDAINEILSHLDPHSIYIPAKELRTVNEEMRGNFQGIGVEFQIFNDTVNVTNVIPGGPSEKAGMLTGDKFITVQDSVKVAGVKITADAIRNLLRGPAGSTVKVSVLRDHSLKEINIKRGTIPLPSVDAAYIIAPETGYIHINKFSETTYVEFMQAMEKLQTAGMKKLILDLRGNGGGILQQATNIADEFLDDEKMIVYTKGAKIDNMEIRAGKEGVFETGQLTVLVDETSASASEVLSGALQDWDRATIIGRRTFGKGLVQQQYLLSDGGALRLTVARYYTPLGRNIQKPYNKGVENYDEELIERFHNGEVVHGDTSAPTGPAFKTKSGRLVYGGGGITPDIFVPFDTTAQPKQAIQMYVKGTLTNFVYHYYLQNKSALKVYKDPVQLYREFNTGDSIWNRLAAYASKDSIDLRSIPAKAKSDMLRRFKALLARQIWRTEGYIEVSNEDDPMIKEALTEMK